MSPLINAKQLIADAAGEQARLGSIGLRSTFAAVREALPHIKTLRSTGISWTAIAAALGRQGVTEGSGERLKPITRSRLTAVVRQIEVADQRKAEKLAARSTRQDLASNGKKRSETREIALSPELAVKANSDSTAPAELHDEAALRRKDLDEIGRKYKKRDESS